MIGDWHKMGFLSTALMFLVYRRLGEIMLRMARLMARFRAGTLRPGTPIVYEPPAPAKPRVRKPRAKVDRGRTPLPRGMLAVARRQGCRKLPRD